jgi:hypothetical protein
MYAVNGIDLDQAGSMDGSVLYSLVALADIGKACCPTSLAATSDIAFGSAAERENGLRMQNPPIPDTVARHCSNE